MANNPLLVGALVTPLIGAVIALIFAKSNRLQRSLAVLTGLVAWVLSIALLVQVHDSGIQTYALGNWSPPYGILLVADSLGAPLRLHGYDHHDWRLALYLSQS